MRWSHVTARVKLPEATMCQRQDTPRQICSAIAAYLEWPLNDHSGERRDQLLYGFSTVEYF
jgi:hypothetical protein